LASFRLLDFAPLGVPIVCAGIGYMAIWGQRRLPSQPAAEPRPTARPAEGDLVEIYRLGERLFQVHVPAGSHLIGKPLTDSTFRELYGLNVLAIERQQRSMLSPSPNTVLRQGDKLLVAGRLEEFRSRDVEPYLEILPPRAWSERDLKSPTIVVFEAILAPRSSLIDQTLRGAHFREKYGTTVMAIWRAGRPIRTGLSDLQLQFGDVLLLQGSRERLSVLRAERDLIVLADGEEEVAAPASNRGWLAPSIMGLTLVLAALNPDIIGELMLGGALALVLARVLTMDQMYRAIEWKTIFLIAGTLPMGIALSKTGLAGLMANQLITFMGAAGPLALLAGLLILTTLLNLVIPGNGATVAAMMTPIAIQTAHQIGADPRALAMGVALGTSMAFMTPLGHPVNILVMSSGGYRFRDYFNVGLPLTLLLWAVVIGLLPVFWPLMPH
jgi:di/tricarboxylate transporter